MKRIFYSYDGVIWYWGIYSKEDVAALRRIGLKVMDDNWWNRSKLS